MIDKIHGPSLIDAYTKHNQQKHEYNKKEEENRKDKVDISDEAKFRQIIDNASSDNNERIMLLKQAIENKTYQIDINKIADKMVDYLLS